MKSLNIKQIFQVLLTIVITVVIIRTFFIDSFVVKGDSMAPTILSGDYVFVDKFSKYLKSFRRGDIIVVKPRSENLKIIKRIVGLPDERVEIAENKVWIKNDRKDIGAVLSEIYLNLQATPSIGIGAIHLDIKEYFVLGDNRYASIDSRELGPVDEWNIEGRVFIVLKSRFFYLIPSIF